MFTGVLVERVLLEVLDQLAIRCHLIKVVEFAQVSIQLLLEGQLEAA